MGVKKKFKQDGSASALVERKQVIKVNPFENPENVLELMAKICSAKPSAEPDGFWDALNEAYERPVNKVSLAEYLDNNRKSLLNPDFKFNLTQKCREISWSLMERENTEHTQIVVAGGFSSGKSSFLNQLTTCIELLPTGTEPVSVVKTYLYCSNSATNISVRGVNHKNVLVNLNTGVLQAIKHASASNIYLASVLDKLLVEIPSKELEGLAFIDTPGYNNTLKANESNGKSDRDTAIEALAEGQVLFWFIGSDRPTITVDDIEIIRHFNGRKVFIFNKADKHGGYKESQRIVEESAKIIFREFDKGEVIDIIAFSSMENKLYYSYAGLTLANIVKEARHSGNGKSELNNLISEVEALFDDEIAACETTRNRHAEDYHKEIEKKDAAQKEVNRISDFKASLMNELREVVIDGYDEAVRKYGTSCDKWSDCIDKFSEFINEVDDWDSTDHVCWDNNLRPKIKRHTAKYNKCCEDYNSFIGFESYTMEWRQQLLERVNQFTDVALAEFQDYYDQTCKDCDYQLEHYYAEQEMQKVMTQYKEVFMNGLKQGIRSFQQQNKPTSFPSESGVPNVFDCIKNKDYKAFLHSFENGVDIAVCNADGFNPLTYAISEGQDMMVAFLLDKDADPRIMDKRGYNAFHTSVEHHHRSICKRLLDYDPDIISTVTKNGETVEELINKGVFTEWIESELQNVF